MSGATAAIQLDLVAGGLSFPTSVRVPPPMARRSSPSRACRSAARPWAGGSCGSAPAGRASWRIGCARRSTGSTAYHDVLLVSEGGHPAGITRLNGAGVREPVLSNLPGPGNYHTNMTLVGPDGRLYFSQGALTNTGIVGLDAYEIGWLRRLPACPRHPRATTSCSPASTSRTATPAPTGRGPTTETGAFRPFGTRTRGGGDGRGRRCRARQP